MWTAGLRARETSDGVMPLSSGLASPSEHVELDTRLEGGGGGASLCCITATSRHRDDVYEKNEDND